MIAWLVASLAIAQTAPSSAPNRQFRQMQLVDGRTIVAEVLATKAEGMQVRTPQGDMTLSYEVLLDIQPVDQARYDAQDPWVVLVAAPEARLDQVTALLDAIPALVVWTSDGTVGQPDGPVDLAGAEQAALRTCATDPGCMKGALGQGAGWKLIVAVQPATDGVVVHGLVSTGDTPTDIAVKDPTDAAMWTALHQALGLGVPASPPPTLRKTSEEEHEHPPRGSAPAALAFAPVPGLPALANGDGGRFALSLAVALPATAAWVGAVGTNAESIPEHAALGAVGFYAITVLANELVAAPGHARASRRRPEPPPIP